MFNLFIKLVFQYQNFAFVKTESTEIIALVV
jgi:hypothetical protein